MNVPILSEPSHAVKRDKKNTALSKHKKWLHDLQKERVRLQEALLEDDDLKRQQKAKYVVALLGIASCVNLMTLILLYLQVRATRSQAS